MSKRKLDLQNALQSAAELTEISQDDMLELVNELIVAAPEQVIAKMVAAGDSPLLSRLKALDEALVAGGDAPYAVDLAKGFGTDPLALFYEEVSVNVSIDHLFNEASSEEDREIALGAIPLWMGDILASSDESEVVFNLSPYTQKVGATIRDCLKGAGADCETAVALILVAAQKGASTIRFTDNVPALSSEQVDEIKSRAAAIITPVATMQP